MQEPTYIKLLLGKLEFSKICVFKSYELFFDVTAEVKRLDGCTDAHLIESHDMQYLFLTN